ncbi:MAG TPA: PEP-CTERM sorting domain-containing protein [Burkholderiaceae bacterium]|nr:PEP-CTERM sorting domain-containing protein [Burkholderiaceae bacterium]
MQIKTLLAGVVLGLSMAVSAHAQSVTTSWDSWFPADHPGYSPGTGVGYLGPSSSEFPAALHIDNTGKLYGGLYGPNGFYYTGAADAEFLLAATLEPDVSSIRLSILFGGLTFTEAPRLSLNSQSYAFDTETISPAPVIPGFEDFSMNVHTYNWNLSGVDLPTSASSFEIDWTFDAHVAFVEIDAVQYVIPVPEPTTHAMMLAGMTGIAGAVARRRKLAKHRAHT